MDKKDFILEIGTEELPAAVVCSSDTEAQRNSLVDALIGGIDLQDIKSEVYITPRRIIIFIKDLPLTYKKIEQGPPKAIAYEKDGKPTKALEGFLRKINATEDDIREIPEKDSERIKIEKYVSIKELIRAGLPKLLLVFSSYKNMRWEEVSPLFPRPIRWVLAILGNEVIRCNIDSMSTGNITFGHHLLKPQSIKIKNTNDYFKKLRRCNVIYSHNERREVILKYLRKKNWHRNEQLLDEVAGLVEYPDFIDGEFDKEYLKLPKEVLIASMSKNQRVFPLQGRNGNLANRFVGVINGRLGRRKRIKIHYEQVLDAKLKDALFFYNEDLKKTLSERAGLLKAVVFHKRLGSYFDKVERLKKFAVYFKDAFKLSDSDYKNIVKACEICKADLLTQMVGEFPSLQGVMGKYYALAEGIDKEIAQAIEEHYRPRFSDDKMPESKIGSILALLDKFDSVICHFKVGHQPKGNWDLYALRRQSIGIINIILTNAIELSLTDIFDAVFKIAPGDADKEKIKNEFIEFIKERLNAIMSQQYKFRYDLIDAVISTGFDNIYNFLLRMKCLNNIINELYFEQARCVVWRTHNITKNAARFIKNVDISLVQSPEEKELLKEYENEKNKIISCVQKGEYDKATNLYANAFFVPAENFFNKVMVNVEDERLRNNRLKLLKEINELYVKNIADLSKVVLSSKL